MSNIRNVWIAASMNGMSSTSSAVNTLYGVAPMSARDARISSVGPATQNSAEAIGVFSGSGMSVKCSARASRSTIRSGLSDVDVPGNDVARPTISIGTAVSLRSIEDGS